MTEKQEQNQLNKADLKEVAINIKGKEYVMVKDRILFFNAKYINGTIQTKMLSDIGADMVIFMAKVTPDIDKPERYFTGYSQAIWGEGMVNKTAAMENAETSAVGRALAMMGIGIIDSVSSADEMAKAEVQGRETVSYDPVKEPDAYDRAMQNKKCSKCGGEMVRNPKTGNYFCKAKCWLNN